VTTELSGATAAFLLAFPALFSIVNPIGGAFIYNEVTADLTHVERAALARKVGFYSALVLLGALWGGAYILNFFGISLGALRVAGGVFVALRAWNLLSAPERQEERKQAQAESAGRVSEDIAFFPMTLPFTTGPGTISVAVALSAGRPVRDHGLLPFFLGVSGAAVAVALVVWIAYRSADQVANWLGASARRTLTRLTAFLLLCIGTQITINGVEDVVMTIAHTVSSTPQ
jgi:multiple antibiotic resistance protein